MDSNTELGIDADRLRVVSANGRWIARALTLSTAVHKVY